MKLNIIFTIIMLVIFADIAYSAPASQSLALNHETKECAMYWAGDEFVNYNLPSDWKSYYIDYTNGTVKTEIGNCNVTPRYDTPGFEECCNQLGYTYIPGNIGKDYSTGYPEIILLESPVFWFIIIAISLIILFFYFRKKGKKKK